MTYYNIRRSKRQDITLKIKNMSTEKREVCECCGRPISIYKHYLTPNLVKTFLKFVIAVKKKGINDVHLQRDIDLDKNEYNNFQKLRYFGLVHHADRENQKSGRWLLTKIGGEFARNERSIRRWVPTKNNRIDEEHREEAEMDQVFIKDFYPKFDQDYWQKEFGFNFEQGRLI